LCLPDKAAEKLGDDECRRPKPAPEIGCKGLGRGAGGPLHLTTHPSPGATLRAVTKPSPSPANGDSEAVPSGALYLVGTPIGNLEDITLRALRTLKEVDLIACEDTRHTMTLLNHYGIEKPTISYHEHNELTRAAELVVHLERGDNIAMVSDAGMPGVSDPGYRLVALAVRHHIRVVPIPGASAFLSALVASGLPTDSFHFVGFLPAKEGARRTMLEHVRNLPRTQIFYEAPHRIVETLRDIVDILGLERHVVVAREVTKLHEEFLRGSAAAVLAELEQRGDIRGEITLLIGKADDSVPAPASSKDVAKRIRELMAAGQLDEKAALKQAAKEFGLSKSAIYREFQRGK
jgi:16S rRNA (cytidine1402-2'-O)-methyltransferase